MKIEQRTDKASSSGEIVKQQRITGRGLSASFCRKYIASLARSQEYIRESGKGQP